jgi:hypothetical protein
MTSSHSSKADRDEELRQIVESHTRSILEQFESRIVSRLEHIENRMRDLETEVRASNPRNMNPLTSDDVRRLKELLDKARRAELFTREEAKEYDSIVRKVEAELPDDYRVWLLVTLAKFMKGLYPDLQRHDAQ